MCTSWEGMKEYSIPQANGAGEDMVDCGVGFLAGGSVIT